VAFVSTATNIVAGDTNGAGDVFVRDLKSKTTERVSLTTVDTEANDASDSPSISDNGRFVAFGS